MKINKIIIGICIFLLLLSTVSAISQPFETTSVSRIVGHSIEDMKKQLDRSGDDLVFDKYILSGRNDGTLYTGSNIPKKYIDDYDYVFTDAYEFESSIEEDASNLILIDPYHDSNTMTSVNGLNEYEIQVFSDELDSGSNLVIYNSEVSGLYIPNEDSLVGSTAPYANVIGSTFYKSTGFQKSLLCNLGKHEDLGEAFREARNNYYYNYGDNGEMIGIALTSYHLYGLQTKELPQDYIEIRNTCEKYFEDFEVSSAQTFTMQSSLNTYSKTFEFTIPDYEIKNIEGYEIIETNETFLTEDPTKLVLPRRILIEEFPKKTIITSAEVLSMDDPVSFNVNTPLQGVTKYENRTCYEDSEDASVFFSNVYNKDKLLMVSSINPVQINNCTNGDVTLYKTITYRINYIPFSPVEFISLDSNSEVLPDSLETIDVEIENILGNEVNGFLIVKDENNNIIAARNITTNETIKSINYVTPEEKGFYTYKVEFYQSNESMTYKEFSFVVSDIEMSISVTRNDLTDVDVTYFINNHLNSTINTTLDYYLVYNSAVEEGNSIPISLYPGMNTYTTTFSNLDRSKISYDLLAGFVYGTEYITATSGFLVEHAPIILQSNIQIFENETYTLNSTIYDEDGDNLTITYNHPLNYSEGWIALFNQSGNYTIIIQAYDGFKTSTKYVNLEILNKNRYPTIEKIENIFAMENDTIIITPIYSDPDNENDVSNDDNNLTIIYSPLIENGIWETNFSNEGFYQTYISVYDGEFESTTYFNITIENFNRAPVINTSLIIVNEKETINLSEFIYDLDNLNEDTQDDQNLTIFAEHFTNGIWNTGYDDSGIYNISVNVTDGQANTIKDIIIIINNINQPPILFVNQTITSPENTTIFINAIAIDFDNENNDSNDNNNITIYFESPFNSSGQWTPNFEESGFYNISVTANDGLDNTTQFVYINVTNLNRKPTIQKILNTSISEGEFLNITPIYYDPDNENNVTNDDNNLTIYSSIGNIQRNILYNESGIYEVEVIVSDGELNDSTIFNLIINNTNRAPNLSSIPNQIIINETETISIDLSNLDPDNMNEVSNDDNTLDIEFTGILSNSGVYTSDYDDAGVYQSNISVFDGEFNVSKTINITILNLNRPPVTNYNNITGNENELIIFNPNIYDLDNESITVTYYGPLNESGKWQTNYDDSGNYYTYFDVSDGIDVDRYNLTITINNVNRAPTIESIANQTINEGDYFSVNPIYSDPDNENLVNTDDNNLTLKENGILYDNLTLNATYEQSGVYLINIIVSDGDLEDSINFTLTINNVNRAPNLSLLPNTIIINEGDSYLINTSNFDPDNYNNVTNDDNILEITYSNLFNEEGYYYADYNSSGNYTSTISVFDGEFNVSKTINIIVTDVNRAPIIDFVEDIVVNENETVNYPNAYYYDPDGDFLNISYTTPLDNGSWITDFEDAGVYYCTLSISDGEFTVTKEFKITIQAVNRMPILEEIGNKQLKENETLEFNINVIDPDGDELIYGVINLPEGASFNGNEFSYTPDFVSSGVYTVTFYVSDGEFNISETIIIDVLNNNRLPLIELKDNYEIKEGETLTFELPDEDADGEIILYTIIGMPESSSFENNIFTFSPNYTQAGNYNLTIIASDLNINISKEISIEVIAVNYIPEILNPNYDLDETIYCKNNGIYLYFDIYDEDSRMVYYTVENETASKYVPAEVLVYTECDTKKLIVTLSDGVDENEYVWNINQLTKPVMNKFDGDTSFEIIDAPASELISFFGFTLEIEDKGKIRFLDRVDLTQCIDFDRCVNIENNLVSIDTRCLPGLNERARISLYNINSTKTPEIYYYNGITEDIKDMNKCTTCNIVSFNDNTFVFDVDGFSTYAIITDNSTTTVVTTDTLTYSGLEITIDVKSDSDRENDISSGDTIKAEPGDDLEFKINIKNPTLEDLEVEAEVIIDDVAGDDLEDDVDFDVDAEDREDDKIEFTIPENAEHDEYDVELTLYLEFDNGTSYDIDYDLTLDVKRERHEIIIENIDLSKNLEDCGYRGKLSTTIVNRGRDEEDVTLELVNNELNINKKIEFEADYEYDDKYKKSFDIKTKESGKYNLILNAYYDDILADTEEIMLEVEECEIEVINTSYIENDVVVDNTRDKSQIYKNRVYVPESDDKFEWLDDNKYYLILSLVIFGILLELFILASSKNKRNRRRILRMKKRRLMR